MAGRLLRASHARERGSFAGLPLYFPESVSRKLAAGNRRMAWLLLLKRRLGLVRRANEFQHDVARMAPIKEPRGVKPLPQLRAIHRSLGIPAGYGAQRGLKAHREAARLVVIG